MTGVELVPMVASAVALIGAGLTYKHATRANDTSDRKVDLEAHRDALDRLKKIIEDQDRYIQRIQAQADRVQAQSDRMQDQLGREQEVSSQLRGQTRILQEQVKVLQGQITAMAQSRDRLERMLSEAGISRRAGGALTEEAA